MSLARHGHNRLNHSIPRLAGDSHIWISDQLLSETWTRFRNSHQRLYTSLPACPRQSRPLRHSRQNFQHVRAAKACVRYGSSTPGPLEARKRVTKKRMTGLASVGSPPPVDLASIFSLKSWLPSVWGSPAGKMKWEAPDARLWSTGEITSSNETAQPLQCEHWPFESQLIKETDVDLPSLDPCHKETENKDTGSQKQRNLAFKANCTTSRLQDAKPQKVSGRIHRIEGNQLFTVTGRQSTTMAFDFDDPDSVVRDLESQHTQDLKRLQTAVPLVIEKLLSCTDERACEANGVILSWILSWLKSDEARACIIVPFIRSAVKHVEVKTTMFSAHIAKMPWRHRALDQLCLSSLRVILNSQRETLEMLADSHLMTRVMFVLANCEDAEASCQVAGELCRERTGGLASESLISTFLQNYPFPQNASESFIQDVQMERCLPLAAFLKSIREPVITTVTMQRFNKIQSAHGRKFINWFHCWVTALRLSDSRLPSTVLLTLIKTLEDMGIENPKLLADLLKPLPRPEQCITLLSAWTPKQLRTTDFRIYLSRMRLYSYPKEVVTDAESYWQTRTPVLSLFVALREISPRRSQKYLPQLLGIFYHLKDYSLLAQIRNYMAGHNEVVPFKVFETNLELLATHQPEVIRHLLDHDPRLWQLNRPEWIETLIQAGVEPRKIIYLLQQAVGLSKKLECENVRSSAISLTGKHVELLCRACEAWEILPSPRGTDCIVPWASMGVGDKINSMAKVVAMFAQQPEALNVRILSSMYRVVVEQPILEQQPVARWRLQFINKLARSAGFIKLSHHYTSRALSCDLSLDLQQQSPQILQKQGVLSSKLSRKKAWKVLRKVDWVEK